VLIPDLYDLPGSKPLCVVKTLKAHEAGEGQAFEQLEACRQRVLVFFKRVFSGELKPLSASTSPN
jgi:hypothetical protein